jgi:hypothetical protein
MTPRIYSRLTIVDKYELQYITEIPEGYYRVREGKLQPDDLVLSVMEKIFLRADDPTWLFPAIDAENVTCAIRKARHAVAAGQSTRSYQIKRPPESERPNADTPTQTALFD